MASIERRFPDKAQAIREAHAQAVTYLQRSQSALHTLLEPGTQNARNRALIQTFFDVEHVDQPLLDRLNETIGPLLARFLHPDLSPLTSSKYVVCRSRFNDKAVAWIHRWDLHKRLYLSEHFFSTLFETPNALSQAFVKATQPPFRTNVHYRAAFMLHEISHQALDTEDINYLNPGFPYEDLLDESTPWAARSSRLTRSSRVAIHPISRPSTCFSNLILKSAPGRIYPLTRARPKSRRLAVSGPLSKRGRSLNTMLVNALTSCWPMPIPWCC